MNNKKEVLLGVIYGVISSLIGLIIAILILSENSSIIESLKNSYYENLLGKLISLWDILNVIVFFVFMKKKQDQRAKGILLSTIFLAILTLILN